MTKGKKIDAVTELEALTFYFGDEAKASEFLEDCKRRLEQAKKEEAS